LIRILSDLRYQYGGKYRFQLTGDLVVYLNKGWQGHHDLCDGETTWAILDDDKLTIMAGYSFDGCSPSIRMFGRWFGTPTPKKAVAASAVHDALRGYMGIKCLSYTRKDTDDVFFDMLKLSGFALGSVYHGAVAGPIGSLYSRLTSARPNNARCSCHTCMMDPKDEDLTP
jgi:hypothetical protein